MIPRLQPKEEVMLENPIANGLLGLLVIPILYVLVKAWEAISPEKEPKPAKDCRYCEPLKYATNRDDWHMCDSCKRTHGGVVQE
jgi:hypothetical protein